MASVEEAKRTGTHAIIFGHMAQGVTVSSLEELAAKTGVRKGPLYEQVMRVFAARPDVQRVEIVPSHHS
jgi:hypothetical protein